MLRERPIRLGEILPDGADRSQRLPAVPLLVERGTDCHLLPDDEFLLEAGDQLLMASPLYAQRDLEIDPQKRQ